MADSKFTRAMGAAAQGFFQMSNFMGQQKQSAMQQELHQAQMSQIETPEQRSQRRRADLLWEQENIVGGVGGRRGGAGGGAVNPRERIAILGDIRKSFEADGIMLNPDTDMHPETVTEMIDLYSQGLEGQAIMHGLAGYYRKQLSPEYMEWVSSLPSGVGSSEAGPVENVRADAMEQIDNMLNNLAYNKSSLSEAQQMIHSFKLDMANKYTEIPSRTDYLAPLSAIGKKSTEALTGVIGGVAGSLPAAPGAIHPRTMTPYDRLHQVSLPPGAGHVTVPSLPYSGGGIAGAAASLFGSQTYKNQPPQAVDEQRTDMEIEKELAILDAQSQSLAPESFKSPAVSMMEQGNQARAFGRGLADRPTTEVGNIRLVDDSPEAISKLKELHKQTVAPEQQTRIKAFVLDGLKKRGITHPISLAMAMASMERESAFSPYNVGDDGDARGLFQWNYGTRRESAPPVTGNLLKDIDNQLDYFVYELSVPEYSFTKNTLAAPDSIEDAAAAMKHYEKYDDSKGETKHRIAAGERWLKQIIMQGTN